MLVGMGLSYTPSVKNIAYTRGIYQLEKCLSSKNAPMFLLHELKLFLRINPDTVAYQATTILFTYPSNCSHNRHVAGGAALSARVVSITN